MILVFSTEDDVSTNLVIDWISHYGKDFFRVNQEVFFDMKNFKLKINLQSKEINKLLVVNENEINLDKITSIWYRKPITSPSDEYILPILNQKQYYNALKKNLFTEQVNTLNAFHGLLNSKTKTLGNYGKTQVNKIEVLNLACEYGLEIPATLITNRKTDIYPFLEKFGSLITKAIGEAFYYIIDRESETETFLNYTEEVTHQTLEKVPDIFFLSLFQEKLEKEFEIRTFFINGKCYSMAIFSQSEKQTSIDFRKYSKNRNVPYKLPISIEGMISKLMKSIDLNTGSIDFVKTKDNRFVFLEVNPIGQYGMTSIPCNYNLDMEIAKFLIND